MKPIDTDMFIKIGLILIVVGFLVVMFGLLIWLGALMLEEVL